MKKKIAFFSLLLYIFTFLFPLTVNAETGKSVISMASTSVGYMNQYTSIDYTLSIPDGTNPEDISISWTSSSPKIATVSQQGKVFGLKAGKTTITAKTSDGAQASTVLTVKKISPSKVTISADKTSSYPLDTVSLTSFVYPDNAYSKKVTWSTSNKKIATVDSNGVVSLLSTGKVKITAKTENKKTATISLVVTDPKTEIRLEPDKTLYMGHDTKAKLVPDIDFAEDGPDPSRISVTWSTSSSKTVKVDQDGNIEGLRAGSAYITAKTTDGASARCKVTVKKINPETITISPSVTSGFYGTTIQYSAEVGPYNAYSKSVTWSSSSTKIAKIDSNGKATLIKPGTVTIKAKTDNKKTKSFTLTVLPRTTVSLPSEKTLYIGHEEKATLDPKFAVLEEQEGVDLTKLTWSTSSSKYVKVNQNGTITAVKAGKATITVKTVDGASSKCTVTVKKESPQSVKISADQAEGYVGDTIALRGAITPVTSYDKQLTWSSSDSSIISVDSNGKATLKAPGKVTITAKTVNKKTGTITLVSSPRTSVSLPATAELYVGTDETLKLESNFKILVDGPGTDQIRTVWSSSNTKVVTVDETGLLRAVGIAGTSTVKVKTTDGAESKCLVTVNKIQPTEVVMDVEKLGSYPLDTIQVTARVLPENAYSTKVTFSVSDPKLASVDQNGLVTLMRPGRVVVTARADNGVLNNVPLSVSESKTRISLSETEMKLNYNLGETGQLMATVTTPEDGLPLEKIVVTWSSSNEGVARVDENGFVEPVAKGKAVITAATNDGVSASCEVTVERPEPEKVTVTGDVMSGFEDETIQLAAEILPANAYSKEITWKSMNEKVATVDENGLVTLKTAGKARIVATAVNGVKGSALITVKDTSDAVLENLAWCRQEPKECYVAAVTVVLENLGVYTTPAECLKMSNKHGGGNGTKFFQEYGMKVARALPADSKFFDKMDSYNRTYIKDPDKNGEAALKEAIDLHPEGVIVYATRGSDAHAVVAIGYDEKGILFSDPGRGSRSKGYGVRWSGTWCSYEHHMTYAHIKYIIAMDPAY